MTESEDAPVRKRPRRGSAPEESTEEQQQSQQTEIVGPSPSLATADEMLQAYERFRRMGPHYFVDPLLDPAQWIIGSLPPNRSAHWDAGAALRMLWAWVRGDVKTLTANQLLADNAVVREWLARQRDDQHLALPAAIDKLFNDRLTIEHEVPAGSGESRYRPGLYLARLKNPSDWHMTAESSGIVVKFQAFFHTVAEYREIVKDAIKDANENEGTTSMYQKQLTFTLDVLNGVWLREVMLHDKVVLTPHFAIVLDAFALPLVERDPSDAQRLRPVTAAQRGHVAMYQITERGDMTLHEYVRNAPVFRPETLESILAQVTYTVYVAAVRDGVAHNDLHPGNVMIRNVFNTPYANRHWVYGLPGDHYLVVPREHHGNWFVEIIDYGRTQLKSAETPWPEIEAGIRYDLQKVRGCLLFPPIHPKRTQAFHGHVSNAEGHHHYDPLTLDPDLIQPDNSRYTKSVLRLNHRLALMDATRALSLGQDPLHEWPSWLGKILWPRTVQYFPSLRALAEAYPDREQILLVGALPVMPTRPHSVEHAAEQRSKRGRDEPLFHRRCQHCDTYEGRCLEKGTGRILCSALCQALASGILPTAPVLGHLRRGH